MALHTHTSPDMFYTNFLYIKKGELGKLWIAAFQSKKLSKQVIIDTNIIDAIDSISNSTTPLALRLSAPLLLGIVRIYERKINYIVDDANDILQMNKKILQQASAHTDHLNTNKFSNIDLEMNEKTANAHHINIDINNNDYLLNNDNIFTIDLDSLLPDIELYGDEELRTSELVQHLRSTQDNNRLTIENQRSTYPTDLLSGDIDMNMDDSIFQDDINLDDEPSIQQLNRISTATVQSDIELARAGASMLQDENIDLDMDHNNESVQSLQQNKQLDADQFDQISLNELIPTPVKKKHKREQKILFDDVTQIKSADIKHALEDTTDLIYLSGRPTFHDNLKLHQQFDLYTSNDLCAVTNQLFVNKLKQQYVQLQHNIQQHHTGATIQQSLEQQQIIPQEYSLHDIDIDLDSVRYDNDEQKEVHDDSIDQQSLQVQPDSNIDTDQPHTIHDDITTMADEQQYDQQLLNESNQFFAESNKESQQSSDTTNTNNHKYSHRTIKMHKYLSQQFTNSAQLSFDELVPDKMNKKIAAGIFYQLLVLKNNNFIHCQQSQPYQDIIITQTDEFPDRLSNN